ALEPNEINRGAIRQELAKIEADVREVLSMNRELKHKVAELGKDEGNTNRTSLPVRVLLQDVKMGLAIPENIEVAWTLAEDLGQISIVPVQIVDILNNLLLNASEAMPNGGHINIRVFNAGAFVQIEIEDSGPGIPLKDQPKIFNLFFSTKKSSGFGLWS